ncbi:hypothetical protein H2200_006902 [Cladophialophora chaetospira]|uniref:Uncharacterized protein n=1 Tax=Cladophialophora chaetospira TaxID=386627 RepID=A0AA39CID8_9EURO|nr:hypothetical protein H2200_006902 [Cladophialophora chaetospira]
MWARIPAVKRKAETQQVMPYAHSEPVIPWPRMVKERLVDTVPTSRPTDSVWPKGPDSMDAESIRRSVLEGANPFTDKPQRNGEVKPQEVSMMLGQLLQMDERALAKRDGALTFSSPTPTEDHQDY